jgi:tripartite-type tricarboxylate transporter receptor subunit TctC
MTIRPFAWLPLLAALLIPGAVAQAQNYPNRPITMIVPFPAGGLTDVPARVMATLMSEKIGQNIVVENKTGATGTIGAGLAARATPDGYTLFANSLADAQNVHFVPVTYSPVDDFAQIGWIVDGPPIVAIVNAGLPYKTLQEMIAASKADPKSVSFGTSGPASSPHMALALLNAAAKTSIVAVPYRGSGDASRAVAGGQVQGVFAFYSQAKPLVDDGKVRALAVAAPTRIAAWPNGTHLERFGFPLSSFHIHVEFGAAAAYVNVQVRII